MEKQINFCKSPSTNYLMPKHNFDVTLALITKNEEKNLQNCLSTFEGVWNHLLIVDTGSTDKTIDVAKKYGAEVQHFDWINDFSAARNFALDHIKTKWTMMIDADDIFFDQDKEQLLKHFKESIPKHDITSLTYFYAGGRQNPSIVLYTPRIWKTELQLRYIRPIHEFLKFTPELEHQFLDIPIVHNKGLENGQASVIRNHELLKKHLESSPDDKMSHYYFAKESSKLGAQETAKTHYKKYIQLEPKNVDLKGDASTQLALIYLKEGKIADAKKYLELAISTTPKFIDAYLYLAEMEMNLFSVPKAIQLLTIAKTLPPPKTSISYNKHLYFGKAQQLLELAMMKVRA